jgi:hypothetical protein
MPRLPCKDCGVNTSHRSGIREYYMVHDRVWHVAHRTNELPSGFLCVGCLERRLGRELTAADFKPVPCNYVFRYSPRLWSRITLGITPEQTTLALDLLRREIEELGEAQKHLSETQRFLSEVVS